MKTRKLFLTFVITIILVTTALLYSISSIADAAEFGIDLCGEILDVFPNGENEFCILGLIDRQYKITVTDLNGNAFSYDTGFDLADTTYAYYDGRFYFFTAETFFADNESSDRLKVTIYDCGADSVITRSINDVSPKINASYAFNGSSYYIMCSSEIRVYNDKFKLIETIPLNSAGYNLAESSDGSFVFCTTSSGVQIMQSNSIISIPVSSKRVYPFISYFSDDSSVIYDSSSGRIVYDGFDRSNGNAVVGEWLIGNMNGSLTAVRGSDTVNLGDISDKTFISCNSSECVCFISHGESAEIRVISEFDIEEAFELENIVHKDTDNTTDDYTKEEDVSIPPTKNMYEFDPYNKIVTGIAQGTTVAAFRTNSGEKSAVFYDNKNMLKKEGILGTGMKVTISDGETYTIIIFGDVTGEGNINSRDIKLLNEYLFDDTDLDFCFVISADCIHDDIIDLKDVTAVYRCFHNKSEINQNLY